ncbi:MAG TPA: FKBP-type peptidyl-prolyl cis-trans isomerase [Clostridia bacterium]|nr:FKBP-type peptidyl-prolyl cis-trans isomerase [Clostridia bacterium]
MRNGLTTVLAIGLGLACLPSLTQADDKAAFKDDREKASYAAGMSLGDMVKRSNMDLDPEVLSSAIKDVLNGRETKLTQQQAQETIGAYQAESRRKASEKNKKEGQAFLEENKAKEGIKIHPVTLPDGTVAELQYKILSAGTGAIPKSNDMVSVNYRGTLLDGKEFDSSYKRGQPAKFAVNRVIRGWTEALQMMKVGSKWQLYIPYTLAYGENGSRNIDPYSTLLFEVELLGVEAPPPPPAAAQPLTSDIIKVPSAEEIKKGAKIEVIKAEDAAKQAQPAKPEQK